MIAFVKVIFPPRDLLRLWSQGAARADLKLPWKSIPRIGIFLNSVEIVAECLWELRDPGTQGGDLAPKVRSSLLILSAAQEVCLATVGTARWLDSQTHTIIFQFKV